jgi:hypothetical protein
MIDIDPEASVDLAAMIKISTPGGNRDLYPASNLGTQLS